MLRRTLLPTLAATVAVAAVLAAPTGAYKGHKVYVADGGVAVKHFKPRAIVISGDGSFYVDRLRYATYDGRIAKAKGVTGVDDCRPNCAEGHVHRNRVRVRLSHPRKHCGRYYYDTLRFYWPHRKPKGLPRHDKVSIKPVTCR